MSVANANEMISLPAMERIIGDLKPSEIIAGGYVGCLTEDGELNVEIQIIMGSTCQLGYSSLTARGY